MFSFVFYFFVFFFSFLFMLAIGSFPLQIETTSEVYVGDYVFFTSRVFTVVVVVVVKPTMGLACAEISSLIITM